MKILIIEDSLDTIQGIVDFISDQGWESEICGFGEAAEKLMVYEPELVVMDWMLDAEDKDAGKPIFDSICKAYFTPTIVFSAIAETLDLTEFTEENPLIEVYSKGDESVVIESIAKWEPYISPVRDLKKELNNSLLSAMRVIEYFMQLPTPGDDVIKYMLNKRASYFFDMDAVFSGEQLAAWVAYEYPPMRDSLFVADVVKKIDSETVIDSIGEPSEYRVILTPSCDMARPNDEQLVLVAQCQTPDKFLHDTGTELGENISGSKLDGKIKKLGTILNAGYSNAWLPLPILPERLPAMVVNLKKLELININKIAANKNADMEGKEYCRITSIGSPYREQIVWAHMNNSCRPGVPVRDVSSWAENILGVTHEEQ